MVITVIPITAIIVYLILRLLLNQKTQPVSIETKIEEPRLTAPPPHKPQEKTVVKDGITYIIRDSFWFRQFVFDDMTLELCVKHEELKEPETHKKSIKGITIEVGGPKSEPDEVCFYADNAKYYSTTAADMRMAALESCCNVSQSHKDLELAMAQCCCTTQRIDEMQARIDLMNLQCQINDLERMNTIKYIPIYPQYAYPPTGYGYGQGCGYGSYPNTFGRW